MADKIIKAKYKIGQKIWYIADGYVTTRVVKSIFVDKFDQILYGTSTAFLEEGEYSFSMDLVVDETDVYPSKKALIKSIDEKEYDE